MEMVKNYRMEIPLDKVRHDNYYVFRGVSKRIDSIHQSSLGKILKTVF